MIDCDENERIGNAEQAESTIAVKTTMLSHQLNSSEDSSPKHVQLIRVDQSKTENSNVHIRSNDELKMNEVVQNVSNLKNLAVAKVLEKEDAHTLSASDAQETMKNSSDISSLSHYNAIFECMKDSNNQNEVSNKELLQRLTSSLVDKDSNMQAADLAQRKDVVNKTILRIVRRFFIQSFKEMFAKKFKSKEAKSKWYFEYVKKFTVELFGAAHPDLHVLQTYMCSIINPKHMTQQDIKATGLEKEQFFTFHNCLYKYSHTRLISLFEIKPLGQLYDYFVN